MAMTNNERQQKYRAKIKAEREALKTSVEQKKYNKLRTEYDREVSEHWLTQKKLWQTERDRDWYKTELEKAQKGRSKPPAGARG